MLLLDDVHWADRATAHFIEHLAQRVTEAPLLVLATYRDLELPEDHPLAGLAYHVERSTAGERIALAPLSRDDAEQLAAQVFGNALPPDVAEALYASTEGNPFFTEQFVGHMRDEGGAAAHPAAGREVPDSVRHVLLGRLGRLGQQARDILEGCAVIGRDLTPVRIAAATGSKDDAVSDALAEGLDAHVLREEPDGYSFAHPLIREAVYQALRTPRRQTIHRRIASGLEQLYAAELEPNVPELAHHYLEAAKGGAGAAKAVEYARRAAAQATAVFAYAEAAGYCRRAAEVLASTGTGSAERCELMLEQAVLEAKAGDAPGADATFHAAAAAARSLGRGDLLANAALGLGDVRRIGAIVDEPLISMLQDALARLDAGDSVLRARVLARLSAAQMLSHPISVLREQAAEAAEMAERLCDDATNIYVLRTIQLFKHGQHNPAARLRDGRELEALAIRIGDRESALYARHMQIDTLVELGDITQADALIRAFEQEADALRQPFYLWLAAVYRAMRALLEGRWDAGEGLAQQAFELGRTAQSANTLALQFVSAQIMEVRLEQGRLAELIPTMRDFARTYPAAGWQVALAFALSEAGDDEEARELLERIATPESVDVPDDFNQSILLVFLANLCERFGDSARARPIYDRLLPFGDRTVVVGAPAVCAGAASRLLGVLAGVLGRWDDAEGHFRDALEMNTRLASPPLVAWTKFNIASMLLRRGLGEDREHATALLAEAVCTARDHQMVRLHEQAEALTHTIQANHNTIQAG